MSEDTKSSELKNEVQDTSDKKLIKFTPKIVCLTSLIICFFITMIIAWKDLSKSHRIRVPLSSFSQSELIDINQKLIALDKEMYPNTNTQPDSEMFLKDNIIFFLNKLDVCYSAYRASGLRFGVTTKLHIDYEDESTISRKESIKALNEDVLVEFDIKLSPEITVLFNNKLIDEGDYSADDLVSVGKQTFIYAIDGIERDVDRRKAKESSQSKEEKNRQSLRDAASN